MSPRRGFDEQLAETITKALATDRTLVTRSKLAILESLSDGAIHPTQTLVRRLFELDELPEPASPAGLDLPDHRSVAEEVVHAHPLVTRYRYELAGAEAIAELAVQGVAFPYLPDRSSSAQPWDVPSTMSYRVPGRGSSVQVAVPRPKLEVAYRLAPGTTEGPVPWWLTEDTFTAGFDGIAMGSRTRRCLQEALDSYRRGLYLAALNLLGAGVEGAWFSAAIRVSHLRQGLANQLEQDRPVVAGVQRELTDLLRSTRRTRHRAEELASHATLLREVRNYGVHVRGAEDDELERFFDQVTCGALILATHRHLTGLSDVVDELLSQG